MDMYSVARPVLNLSQTFRFPAPEGKECLEKHGLSRLISMIVAWLGLIHKTQMLGEPVFCIAWCCQSHWMGHTRHSNLIMNMIWWWLFIKSSRKTFQIVLKTPNSGHKMCEETIHNMWSCVFFHFVTLRIIMEIWGLRLVISLKNHWICSRLVCGKPDFAEPISLKPLDGLIPFEVLWNCLELQLCNIMVIWPWPWIFMVKFWKCCISGMGGPIDMEPKGCESIRYSETCL